MTNAWLLSRKLHNSSISLLQFEREIVLTILASSGRNAALRLLPYPRNMANNIHLGTKKYILLHCVYKVCKERTIYLCQQCNVTLYPTHCFERYMNKCNSANKVMIHFAELFLHFNAILYFFLFLELFDANQLEKLFYQQSTLNLLPNVQVKPQC